MSLINEALRKARKDAAERDAEQRGATYRPPRAHLPTERSWLPALAGVALGALIAAAAFWILLPRSVQEPEPSMTTAEATTSNEGLDQPAVEQPPQSIAEQPAPLPSPPARPARTERPVPNEPVAEPVREPISEADTEAATEAKPATPSAPIEPPETESAEESSAAEVEVETETEEPESRRIEPPEQIGQVDEAVYVLEAEVDGVSLRLDFIVWGANPFAQINGRQVSVGQQVDGFVLRAIAREEVTLEGEEGPFRLRVR